MDLRVEVSNTTVRSGLWQTSVAEDKVNWVAYDVDRGFCGYAVLNKATVH